MDPTTPRERYFRLFLLFTSGFAFLIVFLPFFMEILSASFFAFALFPVTQYLSTHKFFRRRGWAIITILGLVMAILLPIIGLTVGFINLAQDLGSEGFLTSDIYLDLARGKQFVARLLNLILDWAGIEGRIDWRPMINQFVQSTGAKFVALSGAFAAGLPDFVLSLFIFCCALYLFLAEGRKIRSMLIQNEFLPRSHLDRLIPIFQKSCYTTLVASVVVGAIQALTVAVGAAIFQSKHAFLIFLVTFIFSFIPVIGAAPVAFLLAFLTAVKGDTGIALGYVVVAIIAGTLDNVIRPILVRSEGDINPVLMLIAIIGAIMLFGLPGLFLGPMFVSVAVPLFKVYAFGEADFSQISSTLKEDEKSGR